MIGYLQLLGAPTQASRDAGCCSTLNVCLASPFESFGVLAESALVPLQSTLLLLPLAGVLLFWLNTKRQLGDPQRFLSMSESVTADEKFERLEKNDEVMNVYVPPFMKDDRGAHNLRVSERSFSVLREMLHGL